MKNLIKAMSVLTFSFLTFTAAAQGKPVSGEDQALIHKAMAAANECLSPYRGSFYEISSGVEVTGICFVQGFLKRVTFYAGPNCSGNRPCGDFPTRPVAYVDLDCENNVINITCL